jgi:hypothetical protein
MRLFKQVAILLILAMLITMLGGCFAISKKTTGNGETKKTTVSKETTVSGTTKNTQTTKSTTATTPDTTFEKGSELTGFLDAYTAAKEPVWDNLSKKIEESTDYKASLAILGFAMADLAIVILPFFDVVEDTGGVLMLIGIKNAYKKTSGNLIEFGYDYTYTADDNNSSYPAGSHVTCVGKYDMASGSIALETIEDKGDKGLTRTVVEVNRITGDSYASQSITYNGNSKNAKVQGYFTFFKGTDLWCATADKDAGEDFGYNSIYNKKVSSLDNLTSGFTITMDASYVGDKVTYETAAGK